MVIGAAGLCGAVGLRTMATAKAKKSGRDYEAERARRPTKHQRKFDLTDAEDKLLTDLATALGCQVKPAFLAALRAAHAVLAGERVATVRGILTSDLEPTKPGRKVEPAEG